MFDEGVLGNQGGKGRRGREEVVYTVDLAWPRFAGGMGNG
jgi:hypothetical protein